MSSYDHNHPKGTKYSPEELRCHRDNWYKKVAEGTLVLTTPEHLELDRSTYRAILVLLPWNGSIGFIREFNFAGFSFDTDSLSDFGRFLDKCNDPSFEFVDPDLEGILATLKQLIHQFMGLIAIETFPTHISMRNTVPPEWEIEQPERFRKVVSDIHETASKINDEYDTLIRQSRRRLGISE